MTNPDSPLPRRPSGHRPLLALGADVLFPRDVETVEIRRPSNLRALARHNSFDPLCVVVPRRASQTDDSPGQILAVGVLVRILHRTPLSEGGERVLLEGIKRVRLLDPRESEGSLWAGCERYVAPTEAPSEASLLEEILVGLEPLIEEHTDSERLRRRLERARTRPLELADLAARLLPLTFEERAGHLANEDVHARLADLGARLRTQVVRRRTVEALDGQVADLERRRYLRERLVVIQEQLGETDPHTQDIAQLRRRIEEESLPRAYRRALRHELELYEMASPGSTEAARLRGYLEFVLELPWESPLPERASRPEFERVTKQFERSHVGLHEVKRRVGEYLAVRQLGGGARGTVLCFHGPPGTGKSSLGRALAHALGRPFLNIALGAVTHEKELVGATHRRGGSPGVILSGLQRIGAANPVVLLDEIDKVSLGGEGNAAGALLQLLDPEYNDQFLDHYLGLPFDLSSCILLATANELDEIPEALLDRMEAIEFPSYTESEKIAIAREHLLPRARAHAGVSGRDCTLTPGALRAVIRNYTEEAGVRQLQHQLMALTRKAAVAVVRGERRRSVKKEDLVTQLGPRTVDEELRRRRPVVGLATGLAWTSAGGSLLPLEALAMPGAGRLLLTGQVGDVLRESVQTAISYVRTCFGRLGLPHEALDGLDLHLHFPAAATPKDGPSAGIAIVTALVSLFTCKESRHDVAMTGEISLLGQVLGVGGVREKVLAAIRAGIPEVVLPARNAEEILRLGKDVRNQVKIHLVHDVWQALEIALVDGGNLGSGAGRRSRRPRKEAS